MTISSLQDEGKIPTQPCSIVKQNCIPKGNLLFSPLLSLSKNYMHNEGWGYGGILPSCKRGLPRGGFDVPLLLLYQHSCLLFVKGQMLLSL